MCIQIKVTPVLQGAWVCARGAKLVQQQRVGAFLTRQPRAAASSYLPPGPLSSAAQAPICPTQMENKGSVNRRII